MDNNIEAKTDNINEVINMLDTMTQTGVSRIKVETSGEMQTGDVRKAYHHGRCDVGSPLPQDGFLIWKKMYDSTDR